MLLVDKILSIIMIAGSIAIEIESTEDGMCKFFGCVSAAQIPLLKVDLRREHDFGHYFDFLNSADSK